MWFSGQCVPVGGAFRGVCHCGVVSGSNFGSGAGGGACAARNAAGAVVECAGVDGVWGGEIRFRISEVQPLRELWFQILESLPVFVEALLGREGGDDIAEAVLPM